MLQIKILMIPVFLIGFSLLLIQAVVATSPTECNTLINQTHKCIIETCGHPYHPQDALACYTQKCHIPADCNVCDTLTNKAFSNGCISKCGNEGLNCYVPKCGIPLNCFEAL